MRRVMKIRNGAVTDMELIIEQIADCCSITEHRLFTDIEAFFCDADGSIASWD